MVSVANDVSNMNNSQAPTRINVLQHSSTLIEENENQVGFVVQVPQAKLTDSFQYQASLRTSPLAQGTSNMMTLRVPETVSG